MLENHDKQLRNSSFIVHVVTHKVHTLQKENVQKHNRVRLKSELYHMHVIRESVDSLCRDGADMPRPPYIGKACTRPNLEDLSLFRYLTIVYESLCTQ